MNAKPVLTVLGALIGGCAALPAMAEDIRFYAQNNCRGKVIFRYPTNVATSDNCKQSGKRCSGQNDEARSVWMPNAGPWSLVVYDAPDARTDDDYAEIRAPRTPDPRGGVCVGSFELRGSPLVTYHRNNGLDGKVSHVSVNTVKLR